MARAGQRRSGGCGRNNLHVDAVDVEEINARGDVSLNYLCAGGFDGFRERGAIERSGEAVVVDAGVLAGADQREADAVAVTAAEPGAPGSAGVINDGAEDLFVKRGGFFYVRDVDEDVVDGGGSEQRLALGGDRRGRGGFAEVAPGAFGPELNQRAVGVGNEEADARGFAVLDAHLIQRAFGGGEIEIRDAGTEMVDHLRSLT